MEVRQRSAWNRRPLFSSSRLIKAPEHSSATRRLLLLSSLLTDYPCALTTAVSIIESPAKLAAAKLMKSVNEIFRESSNWGKGEEPDTGGGGGGGWGLNAPLPTFSFISRPGFA